MAITRASFAICILLSLATIATADYYAPSSPPVYTSPVNKPTLPPPVYTPPVYKPTPSPPVYKKSPSYSSPPPPYVPKPTYTPTTKPYVPEILKAVDGIILCKNGYETYPILGIYTYLTKPPWLNKFIITTALLIYKTFGLLNSCRSKDTDCVFRPSIIR